MTNQIWFKTCYSNIEFLYWYSTPIFGWCPPIHHPSMLGCRHTVVGSVSIFMGKKKIFHYTSLSFHGRTEDLPEILCIHLKRFRFDNAYGWLGPRTTGFCDSLVASSIVFFPFRARAEDLASWQLSQPPNRSMLRIPTAWVGDAKNGKPRPCRYSLVIKRGNGTSHIYRWFPPWNTIYSGFFWLPPFITRGDVFFLGVELRQLLSRGLQGQRTLGLWLVQWSWSSARTQDLEDLELCGSQKITKKMMG